MTEAAYEVFHDKAGKFRWRLRGANGEIEAQSEAYGTYTDAREGAETAKSNSVDAEVKRVDE